MTLQVFLAFLTSEQTHSRHNSSKSCSGLPNIKRKEKQLIGNSYRIQNYHEEVTGPIRIHAEICKLQNTLRPVRERNN